MIANFPDDFKTVWIFKLTANFPDYFKTARIFPDDCQFSGQLMLTPNALILGGRGYPKFRHKKLQKKGFCASAKQYGVQGQKFHVCLHGPD